MRRDKLDKPLAVCSVCRTLTNLHELRNQRCKKVVNGRRCYGTYKSGLTYFWDACEACESTGMVGSRTCAECGGFGWKLYG